MFLSGITSNLNCSLFPGTLSAAFFYEAYKLNEIQEFSSNGVHICDFCLPHMSAFTFHKNSKFSKNAFCNRKRAPTQNMPVGIISTYM